MRKLKITELNRLTVDEFKKADKLPLAVVLDEVRSLHNIGSVFRTSDAFLVDCIYLCGITATPPHPEMHKTALGAENSVEWRYKRIRLMPFRNFMIKGLPYWLSNRWKAVLCWINWNWMPIKNMPS